MRIYGTIIWNEGMVTYIGMYVLPSTVQRAIAVMEGAHVARYGVNLLTSSVDVAVFLLAASNSTWSCVRVVMSAYKMRQRGKEETT